MSPFRKKNSDLSVAQPQAYAGPAEAPAERPAGEIPEPGLGPVRELFAVEPKERKPAPKVPAPPQASPRMAVLAIHGMGQQIPFETLDAVAEGLRMEEAIRLGRGPDQLSPVSVRQVEIDGTIHRRVELNLHSPGEEQAREVHVYEAYWAPRTQGRVTLRDVMSFLIGAAVSGIGHAARPFCRWMFGREYEFPRSPGNVFVLLGTLAVLLSLAVMNGVIAAVAAAKASYAGFPAWLTQGLFTDLTAAAGIFSLFGVSFGSVLALAMFRKAAAGRRSWSISQLGRWSLFVLLLLTCASAVASALTMVWMIQKHLSVPGLVIGNGVPEVLANVLTDGCGFALVAVVLAWLLKAVAHRAEDAPAWPGPLISVLRFVTLAVFTFCALVLGRLLLGGPTDPTVVQLTALFPAVPWLGTHWQWCVWALLIGLSAQVRSFLIEYVGDVAAYVSPSKVDRFDDLRNEIKAIALKAGRAVYSVQDELGRPLYDRVAIVGHSLGSVIAYDTLNCLINDDLLHGDALAVRKRTCLLLTFGSPLDKIAFLFAAQGNRTSETREALAAAVQPMIQNYAYRPFPWVNVFSRNDIISGSLDFYDDDSGASNRVLNWPDPQATIPLVAHTEYWKGRMVWGELLNIAFDLAPGVAVQTTGK